MKSLVQYIMEAKAETPKWTEEDVNKAQQAIGTKVNVVIRSEDGEENHVYLKDPNKRTYEYNKGFEVDSRDLLKLVDTLGDKVWVGVRYYETAYRSKINGETQHVIAPIADEIGKLFNSKKECLQFCREIKGTVRPDGNVKKYSVKPYSLAEYAELLSKDTKQYNEYNHYDHQPMLWIRN